MKYAITLAAVVAASAFAVNPAFTMEMPCSGPQLSKMMTMVGTMPEGSHKRMMNRHLEMVNTAMAKDGMRGCEKTMRAMHRHHTHGHENHMRRQGHVHHMMHRNVM